MIGQELLMLEAQCHDTYFCGEMLPPYESRDVMNILKYYAQYEELPKFYTFEEVDRSKVDISKVAKHIWEEDMGQRRMREYLEELWNDNDDNLLRLYFGKKMFLWKQLDIELMKLSIPDVYTLNQNVIWGKRNIDHIIPINKGGKSVLENLQIFCRSCNVKKGDA